MRIVAAALVLFGLAAPAAAQQEHIEYSFDGTTQFAPPAKKFKTGCAYAIGAQGHEVSVYIEFWTSEGDSGSHSDYAQDFVTGRYELEVPATIDDLAVYCRGYVMYSGFSHISTIHSSGTIPGLVPTDLQRAPSVLDTFVYNSPGDYLLTRIWQVYDRDGDWTFTGQSVNETVTPDPGTNFCNLTIRTASTQTNNQGRFEDKYGNANGNETIPACAVAPSCVTSAWQTITVRGVDFSHGLEYSCSGVSIHGR